MSNLPGFAAKRSLITVKDVVLKPFYCKMIAQAAQEGLVLTEAQVVALEKAKEEKKATGEIETHHPGYLGAQDTYYVGTIKGVGRVYQQTFIDTYAKVAHVKLYDRKNALVAADL